MIRLYVTPFFLFLLLLWTGSYSSVFAREVPLPEEEAPKALFSAELYDAEVDFFIEGSWTASLQGGTGFTWGDGIEGVQPAVLSDFTDGFKFEQVPQLSLSLWYMDRYFFETTITKEQQLETFLFGYFGQEGEFLQEARAGNTDIGLGDYGVFSIPAASRHSLGAYSRFEGGYSEHHLAARYDPAQLEELHFRGSRLIEEQQVAPEDFSRSQFFVLPDADIDFLRVYVQDDRNGTMSDDEGRRYRRLDEDEMVYSLEEGLLFLRQPATSDVVVYYEKGGLSVGNDTLGTGALVGNDGTEISLELDAEDFDWNLTDYMYMGMDAAVDWQRTINSNDALLLYSPGQWSPFELLSVYNTGSAVKADEGNTTLWLAAKNSSGGSRLPIEQFQDADKARIAPTGFDLRSHEARYPLLIYTNESSWAQSLYGPGGGTEPVDRELRFEQLSRAGGYNLGSNALEGSITVLRNGVPEQRFTFNPDTGELNFFIPPSQNERIDIRYRTTSAQAIGGDIFAAAINRFTFNEQWSADLNLGLRWNADPNAYITEVGEAEGSMLAAGQLSYQSDRLNFEIESGVNVRSPNTTGRLRLFGMDDSAYPVSMNPELMYPGAPLSDGAYDLISAEIVGEHFHNNRGKLFFSDFYNYSFAGGYQLQHYSWDPPSDQTYPYAQSGGTNRTGPYITATGSETEGNAMVMEYSLADGEWVGGTIPLSEGSGAVDLSHVQAITLLVKHIGRDSAEPSGGINLHLLLGRLYEDLDADGTLDEEDSPLDGGLDFNDEGYVLPVSPALSWAPNESRVNSEDLDGNDVLDGSSAPLPIPVIKSTANSDFTLSGSTGWQRITIPLTDADREILKAATGIEFVIEKTGVEAEGRLLIADIDLEGAPFTGTATDGTEISVFTRALDPGGSSYKSLMDQAEAELLNEDSVFNTKVTRVGWNPSSPPDTWSMTGYHTPIQLEEYESFSFFMRTESGSRPDELRLILRNPQNEGLAVEFAPPEAHTDWRRYTWKLHSSDPDDRILVDGNPIPDAQLVTPDDGIIRNSSAVGVNEFSMKGYVSNPGAIEIDEVYLHDPRLDMGVGARTSVEYRYPEALISFGERPVLHQLQFRQTVYGRQEGYQGGLSPAPAAALSFTNELDFGLLQSSVGLFYHGKLDEAEYLPAGGYRFSLPLAEGRVLLKDAYREQHYYESIDILRSAEMGIHSRKQSSLGIEGTLLWENMVLDRMWDFSAQFREFDSFQLNADSSFHSRNAGLDAEEGALDRRYARFTRLFYPEQTSGPRFRETDHSLGVTWQTDWVTGNATHSLHTGTSSQQSPFTLTSGGGWNADLTFFLGKSAARKIKVTHGYQRDSSFRESYGEDNGFADDLSSLPNRMGETPFIWTALPYQELWSTSLPLSFEEKTSNQLKANYSGSSTLAVDRTPGSRLYDLIAPTRFSVGVERALQRDFDSITDLHQFEALYRATALNLFGRLGRYPLFQWYRTEEINHSVLYSGSVGDTEESHELTFGQFVELNINQQSVIGVDNSWRQKIGEGERSISARLYWQRSSLFEGTLPFEERIDLQEDKRIEHTEEIEYTHRNEAGDNRHIILTAGHNSLLTLGGRGSLRSFARIGYRRNDNLSGSFPNRQHTIAVEIGMELTLTF